MAQSLLWLTVIGLLSSAFGLSYDEWKEDYDRSKRRDDYKLGYKWFPVRPTHGQPIPMPQSLKTQKEPVLTIVPTQFEIVPIGEKCDILSSGGSAFEAVLELFSQPLTD